MGNQCPRCGGGLKSAGQTVFCRCGWSKSKTNYSSTVQKKVVSTMFFSSCLFLGIMFYFFQWGSHGLSIITADSKQKLEICMDLKKFECVKKSYERLFEETGDVKFLSELGQLQFRRGQYEEAKKTYSRYFAKGGNNYRAAHYYAHSLVQTNNLDDAIVYFESILKSSQNTLMVTVVESYLDVLVSNNRLKKAKEVLARMKKMTKHSADTRIQIIKWEKKFNI